MRRFTPKPLTEKAVYRRNLAAKKGYSLAELARQIECSRSFVSHLFKGDATGYDKMQRICEILDVSFEEFWGDDGGNCEDNIALAGKEVQI